MWSKKQHDKFISEVGGMIDTKVNGGIRDMDKKLTDYIREDAAWKVDAEPAIENMRNLTTGWKVAMGLFGGVGIISGAIYGLRKIFGL